MTMNTDTQKPTTIAKAFAHWPDRSSRFATLPDVERPATYANLRAIDDAALMIPPADAKDVYRKAVMIADDLKPDDYLRSVHTTDRECEIPSVEFCNNVVCRSKSSGKQQMDFGWMTASLPALAGLSRSQFASITRLARNWPKISP